MADESTTHTHEADDIRRGDELMDGIPHRPGTDTYEKTVRHPETGEDHVIHVPADHDGSRIKVEFPDGRTAYADGWDETERALSGDRPIVSCGSCGAANVLTGTSFDCPACGARNEVQLRVSGDSGEGRSVEGGADSVAEHPAPGE